MASGPVGETAQSLLDRYPSPLVLRLVNGAGFQWIARTVACEPAPAPQTAAGEADAKRISQPTCNNPRPRGPSHRKAVLTQACNTPAHQITDTSTTYPLSDRGQYRPFPVGQRWMAGPAERRGTPERWRRTDGSVGGTGGSGRRPRARGPKLGSRITSTELHPYPSVTAQLLRCPALGASMPTVPQVLVRRGNAEAPCPRTSPAGSDACPDSGHPAVWPILQPGVGGELAGGRSGGHHPSSYDLIICLGVKKRSVMAAAYKPPKRLEARLDATKCPVGASSARATAWHAVPAQLLSRNTHASVHSISS